jgi:hypothetical protein
MKYNRETIRRDFLMMCVAASCGLVAVPAYSVPIHYEISFTGGPPTPTSGSFDYDPAIPTFSNFVVISQGITFDLTAEANSPSEIFPVFETNCVLSGPALGFALMSKDACITEIGAQIEWAQNNVPLFTFIAVDSTIGLRIVDAPGGGSRGEFASGQWTITAATAVPEPATLVLVALGLAVFGFSRRRQLA